MTEPIRSTRLLCGSRVLDLSHPHVMGILNVTPDSFSDGGRYARLDMALAHAESMIEAGATLIDVGGESTRPGARSVSPSEELERVVPVVEAIASRLDVVISVDSSCPSVMRESAGVGAGLLNDVRSFRREGALQAAADSGLAVCLMHMRGEPADMQASADYVDVVADVQTFLQERLADCVASGIGRDRIVLDPGFGFAKHLEHNLLLFRRMEELHALAQPLLVGVSRKSMIGGVLGKPVSERLYGGVALAALAVAKGAAILRVHDVAETIDAVRMVQAVLDAR